MLVPPVSVLLVPSGGNAALGGEKRKKVLWNPVVFDVLEIFCLEVLKPKAMEKKNRYGAIHRKWGRERKSAA